MAEPADQRVIDEAIAWHLRNADDVGSDWDGFIAWLEANPAHNVAYEAVVDAESVVDRLYHMTDDNEAAMHPRADRTARLTPFGHTLGRAATIGAIVAAALVGTWIVAGALDSPREIVTAPGETRTIVLADGTRVGINGATRILLDRRDPRQAELETGEAQFSVHRDRAHPFTLGVGTERIVDAGTVFDVVRDERTTRVEVAEGAVRFETGETRLRLGAGDTLVSTADRLVEGSKPVAAIGSWTRGVLVYRGASLVDVANDLSRSRGIAMEIGPELSDRRFTGVIQLTADKAQLRARLAVLLGVRIAETPDGWTITR